jgi:hypothetical protein
MFTTRKCFTGVAAAAVLGALCAGCGAFSETDAPLLNAAGVKETLIGKAAPEPNLKEHAPLVMPPPNAALPVPGQSQAAALQNPNWPTDPDVAKKQAVKDAAAMQDGNCKNGDGTGDGCRPSWFYRMTHSDEDQKKTQ